MSGFFRRSEFLMLLGAAVGGVCAYGFWGGVSLDRQLLNEQLIKYQALSEEQRRLVRLSSEDLLAQSESRRAKVFELQGAVESEAGLSEVLERYSNWRRSLSREELDQYEQLEAAERLEFVRSRWQTESSRGSAELEIRFSDAYARRLPVLHISAVECWRLAGAIVPEEQRPEELRRELAELDTDALRGLCLVLWIFERVAAARENPEQLRGVDSSIRTARDWLLTEVSDSEWREAFRRSWGTVENRPWELGWLLPIVFTVLSESAEQLGEELLRSFPLRDEQLLEEFAALDVGKQRSLMQMPPSQARSQLQFLTREDTASNPQQRLVVKFARFAGERDQLLRTISFGIGVAPRRSP